MTKFFEVVKSPIADRLGGECDEAEARKLAPGIPGYARFLVRDELGAASQSAAPSEISMSLKEKIPGYCTDACSPVGALGKPCPELNS